MGRKSPIQRNRFVKRGQKYRCCPRIVPVTMRSNWYVGVITRIRKGQNTHGEDESRSMPRFSRIGPEIQSARGPLMLKVSMTIRNWNLDSKPHLFDFGVFFNMWWTPSSLCSPQPANWVAESVNLDDGTRSSENQCGVVCHGFRTRRLFCSHICLLSRLLFRPRPQLNHFPLPWKNSSTGTSIAAFAVSGRHPESRKICGLGSQVAWSTPTPCRQNLMSILVAW